MAQIHSLLITDRAEKPSPLNSLDHIWLQLIYELVGMVNRFCSRWTFDLKEKYKKLHSLLFMWTIFQLLLFPETTDHQSEYQCCIRWFPIRSVDICTLSQNQWSDPAQPNSGNAWDKDHLSWGIYCSIRWVTSYLLSSELQRQFTRSDTAII